MGEKWSVILTESCDFHAYTFGSFTCRKYATWDKRLYFPSEGRRAEDFFALKDPTASAGFEPANLGTKGQHATTRPPKPLLVVWYRDSEENPVPLPLCPPKISHGLAWKKIQFSHVSSKTAFRNMCTFYVTKSIKRETKGNKAGIVRTTSNSNMPGLGYRNLPKFIIDITFCGRWENKWKESGSGFLLWW